MSHRSININIKIIFGKAVIKAMKAMKNNETKVYKRTATIMTEIGRLEDSLKESLHRVEIIERKLQTKLLTTESRGLLEQELELVKDVLKTNEERLNVLRKQNTKSFVLTGALVFLCFLLYGMYSMIFNSR